MLLLGLLLTTGQVPDSVDLTGALARARTARAQAIAATAVVERARGAMGIASLIPNPTLQLELDDLAPTRKLTGVQPLSWLLRWPSERAAGRAGVQRATADSIQMIADLGRDVRRSFFGALAAEEHLRLTVEQSVIADSVVSLAQRRVTAGDISELERDQVIQEALRARLTTSRAREQAYAARLALARAIAWSDQALPNARGSLDLDLDAVGDPPAERGIAGLPAVRAAIADSAAGAARLRAARWALMPLPSVIVGREWETGGQRNLIVGLAMPIPIWNQGISVAREAKGGADWSAARASETRLEMTARLAGARMRVAETAARGRIARDSILPAARRIRAGALRLYQSERTGILPLFEALRTEREAARATVDELLAFQEARADLAALLGQWE